MMLEQNEKTKRVQILIGEYQKQFLDNIAARDGISFSALIRKIVEQYRAGLKEQQLFEAARSLYSEYESNAEMTDFSALDAEDIQ